MADLRESGIFIGAVLLRRFNPGLAQALAGLPGWVASASDGRSTDPRPIQPAGALIVPIRELSGVGRREHPDEAAQRVAKAGTGNAGATGSRISRAARAGWPGGDLRLCLRRLPDRFRSDRSLCRASSSLFLTTDP